MGFDPNMSTDEKLTRFLGSMANRTHYAFDVETKGATKDEALDPHRSKLIGFSVASDDFHCFFNFLSGRDDLGKVVSTLDTVFSDKSKFCVGWNIKFDLKVAWKNGWDIRSPLADAQAARFLLKPADSMPALKASALTDLGVQMKKWEETQGIFAKYSIDEYGAEDSKYTLALNTQYEKQLKSLGLLDLYRRIDCPLIRVLASMEFTGVKADVALLEKLAVEFSTLEMKAAEELMQLAGFRFNVHSPKELSQVLFGIPGTSNKGLIDIQAALPPSPGRDDGVKPGKNGLYSTDKRLITQLENAFPICSKVGEMRHYGQLRNTFCVGLADQARKDGGHRIYTEYRNTMVVTRRLSSANPNLQNIPQRGINRWNVEEKKFEQKNFGGKIRKAFIADPGMTLVVADYSQIELRLMGHWAMAILGKSVIADCYIQNRDLHREMGVKAFHMPFEEALKLQPGQTIEKALLDLVTKQQRNDAKIINFGFGYGMGPDLFAATKKRADGTAFTLDQAKSFRELFFKSYPEIMQMHGVCANWLQKYGYVQGITGAYYYFDGTKGKPVKELWWDAFLAWNAIVQGGAAELMRIAMVKIYARLENEARWRNRGIRLLLQVHDELVAQCKPEDKDEVLHELVIYEMQKAGESCRLPILAEGNSGPNWGEAK